MNPTQGRELFISELRALMEKHGVTLDADTEYAFNGEDELPCGTDYEFTHVGGRFDDDYWTVNISELMTKENP